METENPFKNKTILITGANGWIGRKAYYVLSSLYQKVILVDCHEGEDPFNRFGLEGVESANLPVLEIIKLDLVTEKKRFENILAEHHPDCIIHLAAVLENQPPEKIQQNDVINHYVLDACTKRNIKVIAASSIMVMYGAAMSSPKIKSLMQGQAVILDESEKLGVDVPFNNTQESISEFDKDHVEQNLTYIKTKEALENYASHLVEKNNTQTIAIVRFGWTGIENPYLLEGTHTRYTQTGIYLDEMDLHNFITELVNAVLFEQVKGFNRYICVSLHPKGSWVNCKNNFGWMPEVNIEDKFGFPSKLTNTPKILPS